MDLDYEKYKCYAEDFLQTYFGVNTRGNFICLSPDHRDRNPSMGYDKSSCRAHCFACNATYDIYDLAGLYFKIDDKGEQYKKVEELYGFSNSSTKKKVVRPTKKDESEMINTEPITKYIKKCIKDVYLTDFFHKRGLTDDTIKTCMLGFDVEENAIVIPYSRALTYYQRRSVVDKAFYKPPKDKAGTEPLYNEQAMRLKTRVPIFIVESPICAMSISQCGGNAVALCGTGQTKLIELIKKRQPTGTLIICLDNDEAGKTATEKLVKELSKFKDTKFVVKNIAGDKKDPNELLMENPKQLLKNVETAIADAKKLTTTEYDSFSAYDLDTMDIEPPEFIIEDMLPTGLSLLASPTKYGKSWMMLQLCRSVATGKDFLGYHCNENECLYLALEDSKARLKNRQRKQGKGQRSPKGMYYSIKAPTLDKMKLITYLAQQLDENPKIKLIVIDTLQKVRGQAVSKTTSDYANDYKELSILKEFADDNKLAILLVHHSRKMADPNDPFNNILGSTGIQGVLDTMIVLYKAKRGDENTTIEMTGRDIPSSSTIISIDNRKDVGSFLWDVVGTPEEQQALKEKRDYEDNLLVRTIKLIVDKYPSGWKGKASELINAIYDVTGHAYPGGYTSIGREVQALKSKLYAKSSIIVETSRSGNERTITIKKKPKYASWMMQPSVEQQEF